jgi:hypothetical protein
MLQARLNAASGPQPGLVPRVVDRRQAEKENRRRWSHALAVIAGVVPWRLLETASGVIPGLRPLPR